MKKIIVIIAVFLLSGCAEKSRFDCPYGKGPSCASMSTIDKMIKSENVTSAGSLSCTKDSCSSSKRKSQTKVQSATIPVHADPNPALRVPEEVMQLWIAPYEAGNGIYYQQAYVNIIVKDASWQAPVLDDASSREEYHG